MMRETIIFTTALLLWFLLAIAVASFTAWGVSLPAEWSSTTRSITIGGGLFFAVIAVISDAA